MWCVCDERCVGVGVNVVCDEVCWRQCGVCVMRGVLV